ncbi:MAG: class I SAM-dependent methyltransferase family protein [Candidatus Woesearchaeota archaeon]
MLGLKVKPKYAEIVKKQLLEMEILDKNHKVKSTSDSVIFPIKKIFSTAYEIVEEEFEPLENHQKNLRSALSLLLGKEEMSLVKTAFDIIGDIAIVEIDEPLVKKGRLIGETLLKVNKNVKTVLKKHGGHSGEFRTQKMLFLAGEDKRETTHKENNVLLKVDVERVYFSPRLATERKRIAKLIRKGERVLVMFSGCGPYVCVIAKNTSASEVIGVEINPEGHRFANENIRMNRLKNAKSVLGDVREAVPTLGKFDRVIMPLPKNADDYLDVAIASAKKGANMHFYDFLSEKSFEQAHEKIKSACKEAGVKCRIIRTVKCGQHSPGIFRVCVDFYIN